MYTAAALIDIHTRSHQSLEKLLDHCAGFSPEELSREMDGGFGFPTILAQLQHAIGAERYWFGVLHDQMLVDEDEADRASIEALRAFRERTANATLAYLCSSSDAEVNRRRTVTTWGGNPMDVIPAHLLVRTQSHLFQHQGQVAAICRLLGRPIPRGLDFPLSIDV